LLTGSEQNLSVTIRLLIKIMIS